MAATEAALRRALSKALTDGIGGQTAHDVVVGLNWTLVRGPAGIGLAHTPARGTAGCRSVPRAGEHRGQDLVTLAELLDSDSPFEMALGLAAANAAHNRFDLVAADDCGLDALEPAAGPTVVIGRFPGLDQRAPHAQVIERDPRPGEFPESAAAELLPRATQVLITASSLANGSFAALLAYCSDARVVLVGPGTPLTPALFDLGIDVLSGLIVTDVDAAVRIVAEGGAVSALKRCARYATLRRAMPSF